MYSQLGNITTQRREFMATISAPKITAPTNGQRGVSPTNLTVSGTVPNLLPDSFAVITIVETSNPANVLGTTSTMGPRDYPGPNGKFYISIDAPDGSPGAFNSITAQAQYSDDPDPNNCSATDVTFYIQT
jgi:hypothetical protein